MSEPILVAAVVMVGLVLMVVLWQVLGIGRDQAGRDGAGLELTCRVADLETRVMALEERDDG